MKRFMKGCGITALVLIAVGVTLGMAGRSVAGQATIKNVVETVTGGKIRMDGGNWWGWNIVTNNNYATASSSVVETPIFSVDEITMFGVDEGILEEECYQGDASLEAETVVFFEDLYDIKDAFHFDDAYNILKGNVEKYLLGTHINDLDIEVGGGSFTTRISGDDNFYLEAEGVRKLQGFVEDKTLYIKSVNSIKGQDSKESKVILYVPENYYFQEVEIEVGAGELTFSNLNAEEASLEIGAGGIVLENPRIQELEVSIGAGKIEMTGMEVGDLDVEVGMGELIAEGAVLSYADVECAMGNVEIGLVGSERDFNYYLEGDMGNIRVGESAYISGGFSQKRTIDNNALKDMDIECSMGNITIWFME